MTLGFDHLQVTQILTDAAEEPCREEQQMTQMVCVKFHRGRDTRGNLALQGGRDLWPLVTGGFHQLQLSELLESLLFVRADQTLGMRAKETLFSLC